MTTARCSTLSSKVGTAASYCISYSNLLGSEPYAEGVWQDRTPFNTINPARSSAVAYSSTLNTLVAFDLDDLETPWLSSTGGLTINLEWNNYTILSPNDNLVYGGYAERWRHNEENL